MPENEKEADDNGVDDIVVDRSCIGCDNCGVGSPQNCCARCGLYYYCSKECQVQHWKKHKPTCTIAKEKYDNWKEERSKTLPDGSELDTKEGPCAICLEETITNPVVLPCGHAFCFSCVGKYQQASKSESDEASCPYCRGEIPDVMGTAAARMGLYLGRAMVLPKGSDDQKKYAKLALAEFESGADLLKQKQVEDVLVQEKHNMENGYVRTMIMSLAGMPEETVKVTKEVLSLLEKYPDVLNFDHKTQIMLWQADAYLECGKLNDAKKGYKSFFMEHMLLGKNPKTSSLMNLSQVYYEMHDYQSAIVMGNGAIKGCRYLPGIHKYLALSQKAKGNIEEAKKTMSRAILYEGRWHKDNLEKNKQILKELNDL